MSGLWTVKKKATVSEVPSETNHQQSDDKRQCIIAIVIASKERERELEITGAVDLTVVIVIC